MSAEVPLSSQRCVGASQGQMCIYLWACWPWLLLEPRLAVGLDGLLPSQNRSPTLTHRALLTRWFLLAGRPR